MRVPAVPPRALATTFGLFSIAVLSIPSAFGASKESISGQPEPCGFGTWHAGEEFAFGHEVAWSIQVEYYSGYVVDCSEGTDAYMELRGSAGGVYVYAVWGELGDYS